MQQVLIVGGGFAGLWSAAGAVWAAREYGDGEVCVTLVSRDPFLTIRPRLHERRLDRMQIPLAKVLGPIGVRLVEGTVTGIDPGARTVAAATADGPALLRYDRLVLAAGSRLFCTAIPGLAEYGFSVDTYQDAAALQAHLTSLPQQSARPGRFTALVVGGGLTGVETAAEMTARVRAVAADAGVRQEVRVVLIDGGRVAAGFGRDAGAVIREALAALGVELREGVSVAAVTPEGVVLGDGEVVRSATVVWTAGLRASSLTGLIPVERDELGRLPADEYLRVLGVEGILAAGDAVRAMADGEHTALMSCQHAIPQGKIAGRPARVLPDG